MAIAVRSNGSCDQPGLHQGMTRTGARLVKVVLVAVIVISNASCYQPGLQQTTSTELLMDGFLDGFLSAREIAAVASWDLLTEHWDTDGD